MKTFGLFEQDLKKGQVLEVITIDQNDLRIAEISFNDKRGLFVIWFNGVILHSCKTFKSVISRLNKLDEKFPLFNTSEVSN